MHMIVIISRRHGDIVYTSGNNNTLPKEKGGHTSRKLVDMTNEKRSVIMH